MNAAPRTAERREAIETVRAARIPEDLFGDSTDPEAIDAVADVYSELAALVSPAAVPAPLIERASAAATKLSALYNAHSNATALRDRGLPIVTSAVAGDDYVYIYGREAIASCAGGGSLYEATRGDDGRTVALRASDPADFAPFTGVERETAALAKLAAVAPAAVAFFPVLNDAFEASGTHYEALAGYEGTISLAELRGRCFVDGLDLRNAAWIWRRLLFALGHAHLAGLVHGEVTPESVRILPVEHGLVLTDWCHAVVPGLEPPPAPDGRVSARKPFFPPARFGANPEPLAAGHDIFMATRTMVNLLADGEIGRYPALAAFVTGCTLEPVTRQPDNAFTLIENLDDILEDAFGPRKFMPMNLPVGDRLFGQPQP